MAWDDDRALSINSVPYQDDIYRSVFGDDILINRFTKEDEIILDIRYHIDVELKLSNGIKLLGQEKGLRYEFASFNTFTIEFYQNRYNKEQGEFFNLGAQFYLHSYWNKEYTGFCKWYLIKIFDFLTYLKKTPIEILESKTRPSTSRASFYYINYNNIPDNFIYMYSDSDRKTGT